MNIIQAQHGESGVFDDSEDEMMPDNSAQSLHQNLNDEVTEEVNREMNEAINKELELPQINSPQDDQNMDDALLMRERR
jgi:hypothetical protein